MATNEASGNPYFIFVSGVAGARIELKDNLLSVVYPKNWFGNDYINITASDGKYNVLSGFNVVVSPINDAPGEFQLLNPQNKSTAVINEENLSDSISFSWRRPIDPESDTLNYFIELEPEIFYINNITSPDH